MELAFSNKNKHEILRILSERGAGLDLECEDALHRACENGWLDVAEILLNKFGINPDLSDFWKTKLRPIHLAARAGQVELISFLVANGAPVDSEDANGSSALHYAMQEGEWEAVNALVTRFNANLLKCNVHGSVPLLLGLEKALKEDDNTNFHFLLKVYSEFLLPCTIPYFLIQLVYEKNWTDELLYLLQVDKDKYKQQSSIRHTSLILTVATSGHEELLTFLLKHDADVVITDEYGNTPLLLAISEGHFNCVKSIVSIAPTLVTALNDKDEGPIRFAVRTQSLEMVQFLVEHGANPDQEDRDGNTPLLSALRQDSRGIAEYLVKELHCDLSHLNKKGDSPFTTELTSCLYEKSTNRALWLLNLPPATDKRPVVSKDSLYLACQQGLIDVIDPLLQVYRCDPLQLSSASCMSPFHIAVKNSNIEVLGHLLAYKSCPLQYQAKNGQTIATLSKSSQQVSKMFELGENQNVGFARKPVKIFIVGDESAGKSSLAHAIKVSTKGLRMASLKRRKPTLGIKLRKLELHDAGPVLLYDCSGSIRHQQSSVLRELVKRSAALFLIVTDINHSKEEVTQNVMSWTSYINSLCDSTSYVIVVGSHADRSRMNQWRFQNCSWISESCHNLIAGGGVMLDCRKVTSQGLNDLLSIVAQSCASVRADITKLQFQHLALYDGLCEKLPSTVSVLESELRQMISTDSDFNISLDVVHESLSLLSDKGLLFCLPDDNGDQSIVLQPHLLLSKVLGVLSAQGDRCPPFKETGMIEEQIVLQALSKFNPQVVLLFLRKFQLCVEMPASELKPATLFFPSHVSTEGLHTNISRSLFSCNDDCYRFGWFVKLQQVEGQQLQFPTNVLHLLQMELVRRFESHEVIESETTSNKNRFCQVWSNGVYYSNDDVQALIEIQDEGERILLLMNTQTGNEMKLVKQRSELIRLIRTVKSSCSNHKKQYESEHVIAPSQLTTYPLTPDLVTYEMSKIVHAISSGKESISSASGQATSIKSLLFFDAYQSFPMPSLMNASFDVESPLFLESLVSQSLVGDDPVMIASHLLKLSPEVVAKVTADTTVTPEVNLLNLFKRWQEDIQSPILEALKDVLDQFSIFSSKDFTDQY